MKNHANESSSRQSRARETKEIMENGVVSTGDGGRRIECIPIIGQVEGHYLLPEAQKATKYEHLMPIILSAEEDDGIGGLLILLNTVGGDVEAGLAIAEMIAGCSKPSASLVLGGGHSIGVPLAVSAKKSFIVPSATMTLHPVRINGVVLGAEQSYDYLKNMQERIIAFIHRHSSVSAERLRRYMLRTDELATDMGSILDGNEAVKAGLIDEVGGLSDALAWLHREMDAEAQARASTERQIAPGMHR